MSDTTEQPTATSVDLTHLKWLDHAHGRVCPECSTDLTRVAITKLVYSFEQCSCGDPEFTHLVEQLWHRECFAQAASR